jgi:HK97 family phage prohead protease
LRRLFLWENDEMNQRILRRGVSRLVPVKPGSGVFEGYASLFGKRDGQGDVVMPGAFLDSLRIRGPDNIRMLFQHSPAEPVGHWIDIQEDKRGLSVRGRLNLKVQRGRELLALLESGGLDGLSIGFKTIRARTDRATASRLLLQVDLWEISLVTFPMLEGARVSAVKSAARARADALFKHKPEPTQQGVF